MADSIPGTITPTLPVVTPGSSFRGQTENTSTFRDVDVLRLEVEVGKTYLLRTSGVASVVLDEDGSVLPLTRETPRGVHYELLDYFFIETDEAVPFYVSLTGPFMSTHSYDVSLTEFSTALHTADDDWITWRSDVQLFDGGGGIDTLSFYNQSTPVYLDLSTGALSDDLHLASPVKTNVRNIERFKGTQGDDVMLGSFYKPGSVEYPWLITEREANVASVVWYGKEGNDLLGSTQGTTAFYGGSGVDTATYEGAQGSVNISLLRGRGWGGGIRW